MCTIRKCYYSFDVTIIPIWISHGDLKALCLRNADEPINRTRIKVDIRTISPIVLN